MKVRLISAASLSLSCFMLAWPHTAMAQDAATPAPAAAAPATQVSTSPASGAPTSNDTVPPITVQIAPPPISISSSMLGVSSPLGAQATIGKPVFAEFRTEHHQSFTDGNRISRSTTSTIYRDALGRIRRESQLSLPGVSAAVAAATFITIVDQKLGYGYVLDPQEMIAHRYELNAAGPSYVAHVNAQGSGNALLQSNSKPAADADASAVPTSPTPSSGTSHWRLHAFSPRHHGSPDAPNSTIPGQLNSGFLSADVAPGAPDMRIDQPFLAAPNPVRTENLGEQMILGFRTRGTRVITTLPAGQIGNDRPIDIVSEQWFSPELELVMRSMHRDPWAGEFTTSITRITRGDQPAPLFEVPAPYKIIDVANEGEHHVLDGHTNHSGPAPW